MWNKMLKKIVSLFVMLLILLSFTGYATASTTKKISSVYWDNNDNPTIDKVVITIDTNITYNTGSYYSTTRIKRLVKLKVSPMKKLMLNALKQPISPIIHQNQAI
jgi:uncharacterized lipoprotein YajG